MKMTPPMGWNSWNTFGRDINEQLILDMARKISETGLQSAGYNYIVIDDCWSLKQRDKNGRLQPDPEKFPNGMKAVADALHEMGFKFGMYGCAGTLTGDGYPGSFDHEYVDAATFAEWGVDFLKYDYCFHSNLIHGRYLYRRMGLALKNCGRDILFSACTWGNDDTAKWIRETGANMWRSTPDVFDTWESVKKIIDAQSNILPYGGAGCFNDMDMMVVGMRGKGNVGLEGLNDDQYLLHFSAWALLGSPLFIGCDLREIDDVTLNILKNKEVIAINQDAGCRQVMELHPLWAPQIKAYARYLENGDIAVGFFNLSEKEQLLRYEFEELGVQESTGKTLMLHDVWSGEEFRLENCSVWRNMKPYETLLFRCRVIDK